MRLFDEWDWDAIIGLIILPVLSGLVSFAVIIAIIEIVTN